MRNDATRWAAVILALATPVALAASPAAAQESGQDSVIDALRRANESLRSDLDVVQRQVDDLWFLMQLGEIAEVEKVRLTGPPLRYQPNPTAQGAGNPFIFWSYVFIPRDLDRSRKQPLIVFPHGGVHSRFTGSYVNVLRELLAQMEEAGLHQPTIADSGRLVADAS